MWSPQFNINLDLYDLNPNPDKFDDSDPDIMLSNPISNYYSLEKLNSIMNSRCNSLSLLHCNIRSLSKNCSYPNELLFSLEKQPDIIALSETWLNEKSTANTDILNYTFYHTDSPTKSGGVNVYIKKNITSIHRPDTDFNMLLVESCWVEIVPGKKQTTYYDWLYIYIDILMQIKLNLSNKWKKRLIP